MKRKSRHICEFLEHRLFLNAPGANWKLSFADEFSAASLDTSKWSLYLPWSNSVSGDNRYHSTNGNYLSYMMPENLTFPGDGYAHLLTERRTVQSTNGTTFNYTQAMITTAGKYTFSS